MPEPRQRVTLARIAELAGVSTATVSYVLNDKPGSRISKPTEARIRAIANELGYSPNQAARTLRTGKSRVVLVILPQVATTAGVNGLLAAITTELDAHGFVPAMLASGPGGLDVSTVIGATRPVAAVHLGVMNERDSALLTSLGITSFQGPIGRNSWQSELHSQMVRTQIAHLVERGHQVIGWAAPSEERLTAIATERLRLAQEFTAEYGLPPLHVRGLTYTGEGTFEHVASWIEHGCTAVACFNDVLAMSVVVTARGAGVAVPGALAVIGMDNIPLSSIVEPPLTSVGSDVTMYAKAMVSQLVATLDGGAAPPPDVAGMVKLVRRRST